MKWKVKIISDKENLLDFSSDTEIPFTEIRFMDDPSTGYMYKCPICGDIATVETLSEELRCVKCHSRLVLDE